MLRTFLAFKLKMLRTYEGFLCSNKKTCTLVGDYWDLNNGMLANHVSFLVKFYSFY